MSELNNAVVIHYYHPSSYHLICKQLMSHWAMQGQTHTRTQFILPPNRLAARSQVWAPGIFGAGTTLCRCDTWASGCGRKNQLIREEMGRTSRTLATLPSTAWGYLKFSLNLFNMQTRMFFFINTFLVANIKPSATSWYLDSSHAFCW